MQSTFFSSRQHASSNSARPSKIWWLIGAIVLALCLIIQMPAVWLVNQFLPNSPYIQQVSGNIWQGSAVVRAPQQLVPSATPALSGTLTWQLKPLSLLMGRVGADVDMTSGQTRLTGVLSRGFGGWRISNVSGRVYKQTLAALVNWRLPDAPIQVNAVTATLNKEQGFSDVDGQLTWAGGEFGYPSGTQTYTLLLPAMQADLSQESRNNSHVIHANLLDNNNKRLGDVYLDAEGMLDIGLTQRLLEHMPSYKGSAPADTAVVSVRQPLLSSLGYGGAQ